MRMRHPTPTVEGAATTEECEWDVTIVTNGGEHERTFQVTGRNQLQVIGRVTKILNRNPENYGIKCKSDQLSVEVTPGN